ncbi:MAG: DegV family protein [Clostridia bacterium]|nr:DegV family protein [Clostridia bacterium]
MKIKICADSTCDLSAELIAKYNVGIMPLHVALGDDDRLDGVTIQPQDIYAYYAQNKKLPRSGARSAEEYKEFFNSFLDEGYDAVVHFDISGDMSGSFDNATVASKEFTNIYVVDSRNLSTGTGLLVLDACDMANQGKTPQQIVERANKRVPAVRASFIIDKLEFLYKGGRCSSLAYLGANLLGINPVIEVKDGRMGIGAKPIGRYVRCVEKYAEWVRKQCTTPSKTRCFVTHTQMDDGLTEKVIDIVRSWGVFNEILDTTAGCTVTTHCGSNTIGILFINDNLDGE